MNKIDAEYLSSLSVISHLLEFIDTHEVTDYAAAMGVLYASGAATFAGKNPVLLPVRRDGKSQEIRFTIKL